MAFDAYAVSGSLDDPLNQVLQNLGTRTEDIDGRIAAVLARLEALEAAAAEPDLRVAAGVGRKNS